MGGWVCEDNVECVMNNKTLTINAQQCTLYASITDVP